MPAQQIIRRHAFATSVASLAIVIAGIVVLVSALRGSPASADLTLGEAAPVSVETLSVSYVDEARIEARFPGLIAARRESALAFSAGGRLDVVHVNVGDRVAQGDILAELDTRTLEAQLAAARADAVAARAQAALAQTTLTRQQQLVERGHVSAQRLDEAGATARAAEAQAAAASAGARALEVQLELARLAAPL